MTMRARVKVSLVLGKTEAKQTKRETDMVSFQSEPARFLSNDDESSSSSSFPPFSPPISRTAAADHFLAQAASPLASPNVVHTVLLACSNSERVTPAGRGGSTATTGAAGGVA